MQAPSRDSTTRASSYMTQEQFASYLSELRSSRLSRPTGARPAPPSKFGGLRRTETSIPELKPANERPSLPTSNSLPIVLPESSTKDDQSTAAPRAKIRSPFAGRPLARPPSALSSVTNNSEERPAMHQRRSMNYIERGSRWMEKQEAKSLRKALEDMDMQDEQSVHEAAQDEAAELVWKHQNPNAANPKPNTEFANPDLVRNDSVERDYRSHLRKGSYNRSQGQEVAPLTATVPTRPVISVHKRTSIDMAVKNNDLNLEGTANVDPLSGSRARAQKSRTPSGKSYGDLAAAVKKDIANARRRTSSGSKRMFSSEKTPFTNPNDRIWEDPELEINTSRRMAAMIPELKSTDAAYGSVRKNPFARRVQMQQEKLERSNSAPIISAPRFNRVEIQKNPPTQSRNAGYTSNEKVSSVASLKYRGQADDADAVNIAQEDGVEKRGDDIRAATSKRRTDRSDNLPQPTVVSDKPGRPIVSFKPDLRPREVELEEVHTSPRSVGIPEPCKMVRSPSSSRPSSRQGSALPPIPQIAVNDTYQRPIPTIHLPNSPAVPTIALPEDEMEMRMPRSSISDTQVDVPTFTLNGPPTISGRPTTPTKRTSSSHSRPLPHHAATSPLPRSSSHVTPTVPQTGTLCAHCALPIAGRILSAAGSRFHPACFVCNQCNTNLELVAFYPEPDKQRGERVARIRARLDGEEIMMPEGWTSRDMHNLEIEDGDETQRFYCHLDYHELFSPRCKSCKTPIESKVIVACGAEWHEGHFFCAQCGDPFNSSTPFVEKDGYAWCVGCHTNRYSSKCRKCRKPVTDVVVKALGSDWHSSCFCCMECNGEFQDGRYFLRGDSQDPVCVRCEERRLKA
ncbi:hypothetical protein K431DRAFT_315496 [Polychaeton citri CBS 116435]|uniref:LIM zinc-binding domain-containing protein n=1 Tax=Polychaeton citri CBS 116435 TaxID=1314669 RepID=A0A9P4Q481_9PEZI|nr:hypothetical protein K431DRAFT_315496 [Polychaeton citri CBS 116435]